VRALRRLATLAAAVVLSAMLTACSPASPAAPPSGPSAEASPTTGTPAPAAPGTADPTAPALVPGGSADDNLAVFSTVTAAVWAGADRLSGRAYIDALVQAGFDKSAMQVTHDRSTVGNPAESIQFSVRWGEECLMGQVGPATGEPVTAVMPVLQEGSCLIGRTRDIDW
jgi:hypothetical protein